MVIPGEGTVPPIYDGQYYVNLGLWRRQEANLALRKDVYRAATRINGKTEIYEYDKRSEEDKYWEIQVRMQDYTNYYGTSYNREIYPADYNYRASITNLFGSELELYITYKITLRNTSQNILSEITEVVDYYDKDYTYKPELSWVMYKDNNSDGNEKVYVSKDEYYDMMHNLDGNKIKEARDIDSSYSTKQTDGTYNGESIYTEVSQADIEEKLNSVYIRGLEDKKLATGESAYIYLTFKVNADSEGPVILDDDNSLKENFVEINGYTTYYAKGQKLPNDVEITNNDTVAGLFDADSTPGNLCLDDLKGDRYEKNFEDDTDRAKSIKVTLDEEAIRRINGIVWEDERTQKISDSIIGDGLRQSDEIGIKGVTVELVEVLENGNQYIWQTVNTGDNGKYQFENIIPGNYIVRFSYGHNKDIVLTTSNGGYNAVSYNGQDFKSTVYSQDLKNNVELADYIETHYSIQEADKLAQSGLNLSDAKDLWETKQIKIGRTDNNYTKYENESYQGRQNVNSYSLEKVQNHIAEVLASPYLNPNEQLIEELIKNTNMVAESGIIVLEGEYNRTNTDGLNDNSNGSDIYLFENDKNGNYTINNVDLGLTERPKAQLELNSKVTNVKITLSNKEVLFDAQKTAQNLVWLSNKEYNLTDKMSNNKYKEYYDNSKTNNKYNRYAYKTEIDELITGLYQNGANGIVQATMDEELMHGATIDVIYELKVTNSGETDYTGKEFYYKARGANESNKVVTSANLVTDYVANNLQYKEVENKGWNLIKSEELINKGLVNNSLNDKVNKFNSILQTSELEKYLKPGEEITKTLSLSQTITAQNENDDLTYVNMAEIVQTSNNVGRRMAYSIVGNQDPTLDAPSEVDATKAEEVLILPPFGSEYIYYGLAIAVAAILGLGIFLIKKKVMR